MTAPAVDQLGYQYEQDPQSNDVAQDAAVAAVLAVLVAYFASSAAIKAVVLPKTIVDQMVAAGLNVRAARAAGRMALAVSMAGRSRYGAPVVADPSTWAGPGSSATPSMARRVASDEPRMRARYVVNAAQRLTEALVDGRLLPGLQQERNYLQAHVQAGRKRKTAAQALDAVAAKHGLLVWQTAEDDRVDPNCESLSGKMFTIDNPPALPGAVHPSCRCKAVPAVI